MWSEIFYAIDQPASIGCGSTMEELALWRIKIFCVNDQPSSIGSGTTADELTLLWSEKFYANDKTYLITWLFDGDLALLQARFFAQMIDLPNWIWLDDGGAFPMAERDFVGKWSNLSIGSDSAMEELAPWQSDANMVSSPWGWFYVSNDGEGGSISCIDFCRRGVGGVQGSFWIWMVCLITFLLPLFVASSRSP